MFGRFFFLNRGGSLLDLGDSVESEDLGSRPFSPSVNGVNSGKLCDWPLVCSLGIKRLGLGVFPHLQAPQAAAFPRLFPPLPLVLGSRLF